MRGPILSRCEILELHSNTKHTSVCGYSGNGIIILKYHSASPHTILKTIPTYTNCKCTFGSRQQKKKGHIGYITARMFSKTVDMLRCAPFMVCSSLFRVFLFSVIINIKDI